MLSQWAALITVTLIASQLCLDATMITSPPRLMWKNMALMPHKVVIEFPSLQRTLYVLLFLFYHSLFCCFFMFCCALWRSTRCRMGNTGHQLKIKVTTLTWLTMLGPPCQCLTFIFYFIQCWFDRDKCHTHRELYNNFPMQCITAFVAAAKFQCLSLERL